MIHYTLEILCMQTTERIGKIIVRKLIGKITYIV